LVAAAMAVVGTLLTTHFIPPIRFSRLMKKHYNLLANPTRRLRQLGLTALLAGGATVAAHAQTFPYVPSSFTNLAGTYTDLGTTGTAIATANTDDANSAVQDIGFTLNYNGTAYTQFVLNTNGYLKLGATAPATPYFYTSEQVTVGGPLNAATEPSLVLPFNTDLTAGAAGTEYRVATTGTAGSRVCTIQWKNVSDKAGTIATQFANISFQVKLYEGSNQIDFVYNTATAGTGAATYRTVAVGLKGSSAANDQLITVQKASGTAWASSYAQIGDYPVQTGTNAPTGHNVRSTALPDAGRTYRFKAAVANDAAVLAVYTLGRIATPDALPHAVRAVVQNTGTTALTNLPVTLSVTGANTFTNTQTVAALAIGASTTITFAAYPAALALGTNNVAVSIPSDGNTTNNLGTYTQAVTAQRVSTIDPAVTPDGALSVSTTAAGGVLAVKYSLPTTATLNDALVSFANTGSTVSYQVVVYDATGTGGTPGTALYTSPAAARAATGGDVTVTLPSVAVPAIFYLGVKEVTVGGLGINTQSELPLRPTTFYYSTNGTGGWTDVASTTLQRRLAIEAGLAPAAACSAPTALAVGSVLPTSASISFTAPAGGTTSYQVIYGPTGFNPATTGTTVTGAASPIALTGLAGSTVYDVYIRSVCSAGGNSQLAGPVSFTTPCNQNAVVTTFPYAQSFDVIPTGQTVPCGFSVLDANADGTTWRASTENPYSGTYAMRYQGALLNNVAANDWFFTPALVLPGTANTRYQVAFRYRAVGVGSTGTSNFTESLEVKSGTAATAAGQTNLLYTNASINNLAYAQANGTSAPVVAYLPAGGSTQYVGFHVISAANQGNLYIDDLSVTAVTVTGTSEALLRAVNVFPNPSASGVFNLAINGANAKQALEVEVTNNLGQRVYVGSARDNFTSQLDLSRLATGLYHLKVKNGDEYMLRQISIVK
jgi:hypothetical protein